MAQSDQPKTIKINYVYVLIILLFAGVGIFFGLKTSRLSKQMEKDIALQAVLKAQRDSLVSKAFKLEKRVVILEAEVNKANKNTTNAEGYVKLYKSKYLELKNQTPPSPCDSFPVLAECDKQVLRLENFVDILKANVASYGRLADTLGIQNTYLQDANKICTQFTGNQSTELTQLRKKVRTHKILNWGMGGFIVGLTTILLLQ